ncbi:MAG: DUF2157 domain-containing protein, partial [Chloroflexaceae bacterium]|nr:DUF2157 domain-containing protein [Chloroflexaceae bacterium]
LLGSAMIYRYWREPNNPAILGVAWTIELVLVEILAFFTDSLLLLSAANVLLALGSLSLGNQAAIAPPPLARLSSFKLLPLVYGGIALSLRLNAFNAYTGLITLGVAIAGLGTGAKLRGGKPISYLSILGITCGFYELVAYQLLQGRGGSPADALTIFALVTAAIALIYRLGATLWHAQDRDRWLNFRLAELKIIAHSHWALACLLKLVAASYAITGNPRLSWLSLSLSVALAAYALIQARDTSDGDRGTARDWWVYVGLVEITATTVYARRLLADLLVLDPWRVLLVSLVSLVIYQLPWRSLGWEATPWRRFSLAIPALTLLATTDHLSYLNILAVAAFYARIAFSQRNWRWSYLSLAFIDWAIFRWLLAVGLTDFLYFASAIGASLLFIAQFDPDLQESSQKQIRHWLRLLGSGIIGLTAVLFHQQTGLLPAALGLGFTFGGLGLQIRAFLWVGTVTFLGTTCYQLVILSVNYPFLKWVLGLAAGVILLSIGARFERHRGQIIVMLHHWLSRLETWE